MFQENEKINNEDIVNDTDEVVETDIGSGESLDKAEESQDKPNESSKAAKPDFLDEEFWNKEKNEVDLEKLAKSFSQEKEKALGLRRKLSQGLPKPVEKVEDYESINVEGLSIPKSIDSTLKEVALAAGLSKDQYTKLFPQLISSLSSSGLVEIIDPEDQSKYIEAEKQKLGSNADVILDNIKLWGSGLVNKKVISESELPHLLDMVHNAESANILTRIIKMTGEKSIPLNSESMGDSLGEIRKIMSSPEYQRGDSELHSRVSKYFETKYNKA